MTTSYRDGKKWVNGRALSPLKAATNDSRTSQRVYTTIFWEDGLTSCNCQGWATHKHCKHTQQLEEQIERGVHGQALQAIKKFPSLRRSDDESRFTTGRAFPPLVSPLPFGPKPTKKERATAKPEPEPPKPYRRIRL